MVQNPIPPSIRRRIAGSLFVAQGLFAAATIATFTTLSITAAALGGRDSLVGVPLTLSLLARAAAAYPTGWWMDWAGRRAGLSAGYAAAALGMAAAAFSIGWGSFWGFCAGMALFGIGRSAAEQGRFVAAEVETAGRRARAIGLIVFAGTTGSIAGPQLVGPTGRLAEQSGLAGASGPYYLAALLLAFSWLLALLFLRPDPLLLGRYLEAHEGAAAAPAAPQRRLRSLFARPAVLLAVAGMALSQMVMTTIMLITPLHMEHQAHTIGAISNVLTAHTLGMFGLAGVAGWLVDRIGRTPMMAIGSLLLALAGTAAPVAGQVWLLAASLFLLGLGWNFCFVAGSSLLADALPAGERGRVQGLSEMLVALASGAGSLGSGVMFGWQGMAAVGAAGALFALLLLGMALWSRAMERKGDLLPPGFLRQSEERMPG